MGRGDSGLRLRIGFVLDVAAYGARGVPERAEVERRLRQLVTGMLAGCGLRLDPASVGHQWTGDGIKAILNADIDPSIVIPALIRSMAAELCTDNSRHADRIRLRMGMGIGLIEPSPIGYSGPLIVDMTRLADSAALREALAGFPAADLAVAVSSQLYSLVIQPGYPGIPAGQFTGLQVTAKEFSGQAWIWISDRQWSEPAYLPLIPADPRDAGGYRIVARLGSGTAGRVYLAAGPGDEQDPGWTAVKVFGDAVAADHRIRRRLVTGALAASVLDGQHLAAVTDSDTRSGRPWVASTLVRGPSLAATVTETGPLPPDAVGWLARGLARALASVHEAGLTHRAVTPRNVLLDAGGPVLTDLGTSWLALTSAGQTPADDVLELGATAYYAATGRFPWPDFPAGPIPPDGTGGEPDLTGCPPVLTQLIGACLAADPAQRPTAARLHAWLAGATARQPPLPDPVRTRLAACRELPPLPERQR